MGPNVYWLGLDENVIPAVGEPFYAPTNSSYPTKGRITEVMAMVKAMGGRRSARTTPSESAPGTP